MTLSLRNTIPTLALLVAILMMSGCGAVNKLASEAEGAADRIADQIRKLVEGLADDDECKNSNTLFGDLTRCYTPQHKAIRELQCTFEFDATLCGPTLIRVCAENINSPLCDRGIYKEQQTLGRMFVDEGDWRASFLDEYNNVITREEKPQPTVKENLFLGNLTSEKLLKYNQTEIFMVGFDLDGEDTPTRKRQQQSIFTIENTDAVGTLTLADSSADPTFHGFKGVTTGVDIGDRNDGVSFVAGQFNLRLNCDADVEGDCVDHRYYAGIHATTDLGAPLAAGRASGTWKGLLRTVGLDDLTSVPFDLDITFRRGNNSGTIKADFTNVRRYRIDATFNGLGVITGVITGGIAGGIMIDDSPGTIRGIIGQEGAVAAFISTTSGVRTASSRSDLFGYAGGFVAYLPNLEPRATTTSTAISASADACAKDNTCVDYAHWVAAANPTDTPMENEFLQGTTVGLMGVDQGNVTGSSSLANLNPPGDRDDGFAFHLPDATGSVHNVGIYSTTQLGAPLPNTITSAQWAGMLYERSGTDAITASPITLTVGFSTGSGTGTIHGKNGVEGLYELVASYNDIGVISGTIIRTAKAGDTITGADTGRISGLIGADGAVGVFRSNVGTTVSFVGGFLAQPPLTVDYTDWVAVANPTDAPMPNEFLKGTRNGLMGTTRLEIGGLTNIAANVHNHASTHILDAGDAGDGFAVYRATKTGSVHNAGILSTTDLGAPLTGTITNVQWPGSLLTRVVETGGLTIPSLITLDVNFDGTDGTIVGTNSLNDFRINARFNNVGVISGDVTHTLNVPGQPITGGSGSVTGLIGVDGAVAVFRNLPNSGTNYVGGFVAQPSQGRAADPCIARNTCVDYAHWEAAANPTDTPTPDQFLKGTPGGLAGVDNYLDIAHLDTAYNTNFYSLSGGDTKDGFGIYRPINRHSSGSFHNVGIYSTTNLGAPLSKTVTNALWAGTLQDRVGTTGGLLNALGITLTVGFNAGTKAGTITYGNVGTTHEIDANFDGTGVISGEITRRAGGDTSTGVISGLIGAEGAVGVFHSTAGATTSYVGGFVASPPAPQG